ncbi:carbohydrate ABC transporter permease [Jiangella gansuensis]|uniref:carbohydrate ABC transporter permease n=1 Tax=Jiangella gansuensis TaxID=281473 RepID=UPI0004AF43D1|nr:carbohydrate ABC transporter permease [Jiangella gansuensis]
MSEEGFAHGFAFFTLPAKRLLFLLVIGTMIAPSIVTLVPNFVTISHLGWVNTPQGVIVPSLAFCGFGIFLLRQAMLQIPIDLVQAAHLDGAGSWSTLWRIILPITRPAIAVVTVIYFVSGWNAYLWPLTVLTDIDTRTLPIGLQFMASDLEGAQLWGELMATTLLTLLPPLLLYLVAQRSIISAFVRSGLQG